MTEQNLPSLSDCDIISLIRAACFDVHPCKEILKQMKIYNMSDQDLADVLGISIEETNQILYNGGPITANHAVFLELIFSKPEDEWLSMYDKFLKIFQ